ncbi:MAG TPA: SDR family oxidoreductase [Aggregatilineales bacterium]|nr:SDR family oxidoreductase [Aggregatilineales bacterium]
MNLANKTALLTGPMDALLIGVGQALQEAGATILLGHLPSDEQAAIVAAGRIGARLIALTPDNPDSLALQIEAAGEIDICIIAPHSHLYKPFMEVTDAEWDTAISGNFERALWLSQALARQWVNVGRGGRIIFLSSIAAKMPLTHLSAPGTTLGALRALAKMAAVDLAPHDITVNVIELGWLDTPALPAEVRSHILDGTPTGRLIDPAEVGALCVFLASQLASSITGETHTLDGGYSLTRSAGTEPLVRG